MNKKSILKYTMYVLLLLLLVHPPYLELFSLPSKIYNYSFPVCLLFIMGLFIQHSMKKKSINRFCVLLCFFLLLPVLYTIFVERIITINYYRNPITSIALILLFTVGLEADFEPLILSLCTVFGGYVLINFASIVLYPDALYSTIIYKNLNWFLGYKNVMVRTMLPALCSIAIYSVYKLRRLNWFYWAFFVVCLLSNIMVDCKTGALGVLLFGAITYYYRNKGVPKFLNLRTLGFALLILSVLLTVFNLLGTFYSFLSDIGEAGSISNRMMIWQRALELIQARPLLGYGYRGTEAMRSLMDFSLSWADVSHPHNYYLYILIQGGAVLSTLGIYVYSRLGKGCEKYRMNFISVAVFAMYLSFLTMGLVESLVGTILLYPFMMLLIPMKRQQIRCRRVRVHLR